MFWDKKKDGGLPDLPQSSGYNPASVRNYSSNDQFESEIHELPSFPDSPMQKGFSQAAIKDAVTNEDYKEMPEFKPSYDQPQITEMQDWNSNIKMPPVRARDNKPIFIRLDKFQLARASLETVKNKLGDIEELLKRIREVKTREDAELSSWETEMENIKARIQGVMNDIFDRAEY